MGASVMKLIRAQSVKDDILLESWVRFGRWFRWKGFAVCLSPQTNGVSDSTDRVGCVGLKGTHTTGCCQHLLPERQIYLPPHPSYTRCQRDKYICLHIQGTFDCQSLGLYSNLWSGLSCQQSLNWVT